jgi:hypothetical protein
MVKPSRNISDNLIRKAWKNIYLAFFFILQFWMADWSQSFPSDPSVYFDLPTMISNAEIPKKKKLES